jgi:hypothetical protein
MMDPYTGRTYALGEGVLSEVVYDPQPGAALDMTRLRERVAELEDEATPDEVAAAAEARALVLVEPEVAHAQRVGGRELARRRKRNAAAKRARKAQRGR